MHLVSFNVFRTLGFPDTTVLKPEHFLRHKPLLQEADWVLFQDLEDLEDCVRELNPALKEFENSVFSGCYVTCDDEESVATSSEQGSPRPGAKTPLSRVSPEAS